MGLRAAAAVVGAVATIAMAGSAAAQPLCVGEEAFYVCVDPTGSSRTVCIYAGPPPCTPVTIPIPTAWCEENLEKLDCADEV